MEVASFSRNIVIVNGMHYCFQASLQSLHDML